MNGAAVFNSTECSQERANSIFRRSHDYYQHITRRAYNSHLLMFSSVTILYLKREQKTYVLADLWSSLFAKEKGHRQAPSATMSKASARPVTAM